ncbi:hypothetical protein N5D61_24500 [Pseudomonas sp. GD03842]|uniref:hypothetical protein n=1 Tax=Pseudomonas sp. GD03842 TaxID=2975385 RepID=UPI00244C2585|nr:hypothetical protein [Pseudomonas sp. GD03842]MDH0749489.1 hypothetical protein [Pseudomonas sp. GD03842]
MNIDWTKAPKGATHFVISAEHRIASGWYQQDGVKMRDLAREGEYAFRIDDLHEGRMLRLVPRIEPWNGEGLPPVGTVCELRAHKLTEWSAAKIEFAYRNVIVWDWIGEPSINGLCTAYSHNVELRPIRTAEQIAAEEREAAICAMMEVCSELPCRQSCEDLYEAGYRKQVRP